MRGEIISIDLEVFGYDLKLTRNIESIDITSRFGVV